ncbi:hypothetical protein [Erwinia mallotivora]|uniref:Membrane protein n=1 Tax=Erwinia mallotivora TaxID=69222 RepID=A0A014N3U2_9GAMM|nr:hypothetical protein [Erwinia mallotivora]EXU74083.1 membrane protein [Erwinia mallotivora]
MPIYLDEVPEGEDNISRPVALRWVILLIAILLVGVALTVWQWTGDRRGGAFWLTALGLPFILWGGLAVLRYIGYRLELNGETGWNYECESLKDMEIARGQRFAWVLDTFVQSPAGRGTGSLVAAMALMTPLLKTSIPRGGGLPVRHARITDFDADPDAVKKAIKKVAARLKNTLERLPDTLPCWLIFDCDESLSTEDEAGILQLLTLKSGRELHQLSAKGMNALDKWLDNSWDKPSALIILTLVLRSSPAENDAEAITTLVLCNRKSHQFPDAARLHRPQQSNHDTLTSNMAHSLRWAKLSPDSIKGIWISGEAVTNRPGLNKSCEDNALTLSLTDEIKSIDATLGYTRVASPWIAVALATAVVQEQGAQMIAAQPDPASDAIWLTSITAEERQKDLIRE